MASCYSDTSWEPDIQLGFHLWGALDDNRGQSQVKIFIHICWDDYSLLQKGVTSNLDREMVPLYLLPPLPPQIYFLPNGILTIPPHYWNYSMSYYCIKDRDLSFLTWSIVSCLAWPQLTALIPTHIEIYSILCSSLRVAFFQILRGTFLGAATGFYTCCYSFPKCSCPFFR